MDKQIHIIGGGLAGADDAACNSLINNDGYNPKSANGARTAHYIRAETVPWIGVVLTFAWVLGSIYLATRVAQIEPRPFRCHPADRSTTNGRDLCPPHEVRR